MKKALSILLVFALLVSFGIFAMGSSDEESTPATESTEKAENDTVATAPAPDNTLGDYAVTIDSCRLAKDWDGKDVVIVKYIFENVKNEESASFTWTISDAVFQNGIGLNHSYFVDESYSYSSDNQTKEIKKGASLEVEVAYELNDTTTPIEIEVSELISFSDKKITKTFDLQ